MQETTEESTGQRDIYSLEAAARRLEMSPDAVEALIADGTLRAAQTPSGYRVTRRDLDRYLRSAGSGGLQAGGSRAGLLAAAVVAIFVVGGLGIWQAGAFTNAPSTDGLPQVIPYQGTLAENNKSVDGQRNMEFALFDAPKSQKPTKLWETKNPVAIDVVDGKFTVNLGTQSKSNPLTKDIFSHSELFLRITVDGTALQPWQQIAPAPQAIHAANGVPPGTIAPYGGPKSKIPDGWMLCTGKGLKKGDFPELYAAIGTAWGDGSQSCSGSCDFNLPDLRARFLRGVAHGSGRDPNHGSRGDSRRGGNQNNNVGSVQGDATARPNNRFETNRRGRHRHTVREAWYSERYCRGPNAPRNNLGSSATDRDNDLCERNVNSDRDGNHRHVINRGGDAETRPKNAYVNYIIKY